MANTKNWENYKLEFRYANQESLKSSVKIDDATPVEPDNPACK